jgi:hypothetical protein
MLRTESPALFKDERVTLPVRRVPVVLKVFLHHLIADVARAPRAVTYRPEVATPVAPPQRGSDSQGQAKFVASLFGVAA